MNELPLYSPLVVRALELAAVWHKGQLRKSPTQEIPYIAHPAFVGMLLQKAGYDDETIAAGILHDVLEDCGVSPEELAASTTPRVASLVMSVSEDGRERNWAARKMAYREVLESAPEEALAIAAVDHLSNIRSIVDMAKVSADVWSVFFASKKDRLAHEEAVLDVIARRLSGPLVEELRHSIELLRELPE